VPLRLKYTFNGHETFDSVERAHGYVRRRGRVIDTYPWYSHYELADSGMYSTAGELALFMKSLFTTDKLLSAAMRKVMTDVSESGHLPSRYGMGIFVQRSPRGMGHWYANYGIDPGYHADMIYFTDLDLTIVLFANASQGVADIIYEKLITAVLQVALEAFRLGGRYVPTPRDSDPPGSQCHNAINFLRSGGPARTRTRSNQDVLLITAKQEVPNRIMRQPYILCRPIVYRQEPL